VAQKVVANLVRRLARRLARIEAGDTKLLELHMAFIMASNRFQRHTVEYRERSKALDEYEARLDVLDASASDV